MYFLPQNGGFPWDPTVVTLPGLFHTRTVQPAIYPEVWKWCLISTTIQGGSCGVSFTALLTPGPAQIEFHACLLICLWQPLGVSHDAVWVQRLASFLAPPLARFLSQQLLLLGLSVESAPHPCWQKPSLSNAKPPPMFTGQSPDKHHCCASNNNIFSLESCQGPKTWSNCCS